MPASTGTLISNHYLSRDQLALIPTPPATTTHKPVAHHDVIQALLDTLKLHDLGVTKEQYAISRDGMRCYFTLDLDRGFPGGNFTLGGRNSNDKRHALGLTAGYRVTVCENGMFKGDYTPLTRKHTSRFDPRDVLQRRIEDVLCNFDPLGKDIQRWRETPLTVVEAKLDIYEAFLEARIDLPRYLMQRVHDAYFNPTHPEFPIGNIWSLQNAYTSVSQLLNPIQQQRAAVSIGEHFQNK